MQAAFRIASMLTYLIATAALMMLALGFIGYSAYSVVSAISSRDGVMSAMLNGVGLIIIALAVFDVAKFLLEEEIYRDKELRSAGEARRTLTKFLTIIIIAASLEGLVMIFQAGKEDMSDLIYPAAVLGVVVLMVVALGVYQRLSRQVEERLVEAGDPDETEGGLTQRRFDPKG